MLRISSIGFPGLGIPTFTVDSVAFTVFGVDIAWYAVLITFGAICAVLHGIYRAKKIGVSADDILDMALYTIPIGVIGARLFYILTKLEDFPTFRDWINIRGGGLAIYGALIAGFFSVLTYCRVKKISFLAIADCLMPGILLAQAIGRWGNFVNGEAFGYETTNFLRMSLNNFLTEYETLCVHPTFFYESFWNFIGIVGVSLYFNHRRYDGEIFVLCTGWYGLGRFWIEGLRTDSLYIPGTVLRISQVIAIILFVVMLAAWIYLRIRPPKKELFCKVPTEAKK